MQKRVPFLLSIFSPPCKESIIYVPIMTYDSVFGDSCYGYMKRTTYSIVVVHDFQFKMYLIGVCYMVELCICFLNMHIHNK